MIFCGQCGYQLSPGDKNCPRCGAESDVDLIVNDPGTYNPTEISHAVLDHAQVTPPKTRASQSRTPVQPIQPEPAGPLVLGPGGGGYPNEQLANDATTVMSSPVYPPQQGYPGYPPQAVTGFYGYNAGGGYSQHHAATVARILESSHKGKNGALLLILFGLLLMIGAIIVFLLNQQGIISTP